MAKVFHRPRYPIFYYSTYTNANTLPQTHSRGFPLLPLDPLLGLWQKKKQIGTGHARKFLYSVKCMKRVRKKLPCGWVGEESCTIKMVG